MRVENRENHDGRIQCNTDETTDIAYTGSFTYESLNRSAVLQT